MPRPFAKGVPTIWRIILDDIAAARRRGDLVHAAQLKLVLRHFIQSHPQGGAAGKIEAALPV